jgi:hypothetical protein
VCREGREPKSLGRGAIASVLGKVIVLGHLLPEVKRDVQASPHTVLVVPPLCRYHDDVLVGEAATGGEVA